MCYVCDIGNYTLYLIDRDFTLLHTRNTMLNIYEYRV